jgi:hypothetical protein
VGVTAGDATDAGPSPTALVAYTVNDTGVPAASPATVAVVAGALTVTACPLDARTRYVRIGLPPSQRGTLQRTVACCTPAVAATPVGALGACGVLGFLASAAPSGAAPSGAAPVGASGAPQAASRTAVSSRAARGAGAEGRGMGRGWMVREAARTRSVGSCPGRTTHARVSLPALHDPGHRARSFVRTA